MINSINKLPKNKLQYFLRKAENISQELAVMEHSMDCMEWEIQQLKKADFTDPMVYRFEQWQDNIRDNVIDISDDLDYLMSVLSERLNELYEKQVRQQFNNIIRGIV